MEQLLEQIRACRACETHLPLGPRPIIQGDPNAKLLIIGQAPGLAVHNTGVPWDDKSGERLRSWLGLDSDTFYDPSKVAIMPVGFCYPGRAKSGDAPPRKECFELWHEQFLSSLKKVKLTLLIGNHAQARYLGNGTSATENIKSWRNFLPKYFPLPHPSPRNNIWLSKNPWFTEEVVPELAKMVRNCFEGKQ